MPGAGLFKRVDTLSTLAATDGSLVTGRVDSTGQVWVRDAAVGTKLDTVITLLGTSVASQVWKSFNATSSQTGISIWTPASGKKIAISHLTIGTYGTTAARLLLWFGASADTSYTAGTDQLVFAGSFAPSATSYPGAILQPASPILAANADYILRITTDAALSVDISVYGYEFS